MLNKLLFSMALLCAVNSFNQIVMNEVCSANGYVIEDFEGSFEDWIEVYNPGPDPVSLDGFYFETFETSLKRWDFPNVTLNADSCMLIFCSGKDRKAVVDHYEVPVFPGTVWRYQVGTSEPPADWNTIGFDDSGWSMGVPGIGYGDGDDVTVIAPTTSVYMRDTFSVPTTALANWLICILAMDYDDAFVAYLNGTEVARNNIWNVGPPPYDAYASEEHEAQGYLCPANPFDCYDYFWIDEDVISQSLVAGQNVLAVQVHNYWLGLDDMSASALPLFGVAGADTTFNYFPTTNNLHTNFNLSSQGQRISLKDSNGVVIDEYIVGPVQYNNSRGRIPDGSDNWCIMETPTPCNSNNSAECVADYMGMPIISLESGFYTGSQTVSISTSSPTETIRYTLDGSWPIASSPIYTGPLTIADNTTLRARHFSSDVTILPSDMATATYVLDETSTLPVIFVSTDSVWLFDTITGIYVIGPNTDTTVEAFPYWGTANYYQDLEIPGHVEYLDASLKKRMGQDCTIKIHGNFSRGWPQKSFRFLANDKYGDGWFNFSPFPDKPNLKKFKSFNVRNGGVDFNTTHFRDGLMNRGARDLNMEIMDHQPCLVYLNGEYWGVYGLRERQDEKYIGSNFDINGDLINLLRFTGDEFHGSNDNFEDMVDFITLNDMSIDTNYEKAASLLDIANFCDYINAETFYGNYDWISEGSQTNNIKFWQNTAPLSKWRYILWDTDLGLSLVDGFGGGSGVDYDYLGSLLGPTFTDPHSMMLKSLLNNQTFHDYFINRFADVVNTTFSSEELGSVAQEVYDEFEPEMDRHFDKWGGPPVFVFSSFNLNRSANKTEWTANFDTVMQFIDQRPFHTRNNVESTFGLNKQVSLTLDVEPAGAGKILISTIVPDEYPWTGVYYDGVPVKFTIMPNQGFKFEHWSTDNHFTMDENSSFTLDFDSDDNVTAHFKLLNNDVHAHPNPFNGNFEIEYHMFEEAQASLKLFDLTGRVVAVLFDESTFQPEGVNRITVDPAAYGLKSGAYVLEFRTGDYQKTIKLIGTKTP